MIFTADCLANLKETTICSTTGLYEAFTFVINLSALSLSVFSRLTTVEGKLAATSDQEPRPKENMARAIALTFHIFLVLAAYLFIILYYRQLTVGSGLMIDGIIINCLLQSYGDSAYYSYKNNIFISDSPQTHRIFLVY